MKRFSIVLFLLAFTQLILVNSVFGDHFEVANDQGQDHSLLIYAAEINDNPLEDDDEIAAFTPSDICAGALVIEGDAPYGMALWSDVPGTDELDGFLTNEALTFKIWDASAGREYDAHTQYLDGPRTFQRGEITRITRIFWYSGDVPVILTSTNSIEFGEVGVDIPLNETLTVENIGFGELRVSSVTFDGDDVFETDYDLDDLRLDPGESYDFTVTFTPDEAGEFNGTLTISSNDPNNEEFTIDITGTGINDPEPDISLSEPEHDYDEFPIGYADEWKLCITNDGTSNLTIQNIEIDDDVFSHNWDGEEFEIAPRETYRLTVLFTPEDENNYEGDLIISSDDPDERNVTVPLRGIGIEHTGHFVIFPRQESNHPLILNEVRLDDEPLDYGDEIGVITEDGWCGGATIITNDIDPADQIGVTTYSDDPGTGRVEGFNEGEGFTFRYWDISAGVEITADTTWIFGPKRFDPTAFSVLMLFADSPLVPRISVAPLNIDFGDVYANRTPEAEITVANQGSGTLTVSSIELEITQGDDNFEINQDMGFVLEPDGIQIITLEFIPQAVRDYSAEIRISSDCPHNELVTVHAIGSGLEPPQTVDVNENPHDFGSVEVDDQATWDMIITNTGWSDLIIDRVESSDDAFETGFPNDPVRLERDESTTVEVTFAPDQNGDFQGILTIFSNDPENDGEFEVTLIGRGAAEPIMTIDPDRLNYGTVTVYEALARRLTIRNSGNADLIVSDISINGQYFQINFDADLTIEPDNSAIVPVYFAPLQSGNFNGTVTVQSNDPENAEIDIPLNGIGALPPQDILLKYVDEEEPDLGFDIHDIDADFDFAKHAVAVDLDDDGDVDVIGAAHGANEIAWWENNGNQEFDKHTIDNDYGGAFWVHAADVDLDGDMDILAAGESADKISWWENDGDQGFDEHIIEQNFDGTSVHALDMDDDLDIDIVASSSNDALIWWWENDGISGFTQHSVTENFGGAQSVFPIDLDEDGDIDVVAAGETANQIVWCDNNGNQNFTRRTIVNGYVGAASVYVIDLDDDGDLDVLGTAWRDNEVTWFENNGSENFNPQTLIDDFAIPLFVSANDIDDDGDVDITASAYNADLVILLENDGDEEFTSHNISQGFARPTSVSSYDIDSDGYIDILGTSSTDRVSWWENQYLVEHDFGAIEVDQTLNWTFIITNVGEEPLDINSLTFDPDVFDSEYEGDEIDPGEERQVEITFTPTNAQGYNGTLTIASGDPDEDEVTISLIGTGGQANREPIIPIPIPDIFLPEDFIAYIVADLDTIFDDPDGDDLTYSVESSNENFTTEIIDDTQLRFDSVQDWYGQLIVTVTADDGHNEDRDDQAIRRLRIVRSGSSDRGLSATHNLNDRNVGPTRTGFNQPRRDTDHDVDVEVIPQNDQPVWTDFPRNLIEANEGDRIQFSVEGMDVDGDELTITDEIPEGANFTDNDDGSGDFDWQTGFNDTGNHTVTLVLSDGALDSTINIEISIGDVNRRPVWDNVPQTANVNEGEQLIFNVLATDPDPDDDITIADASDDLPEGWDFTDNGEGAGSFDYTPGYDDAGEYTLTLTASDGALDAVANVIITVIDVNREPVWDEVPRDPDVYEGAFIDFTLSGSDPDNDDNLTIEFSTPNIQGDDHFSDLGGGNCRFTWQTNHNDAGNYRAEFIISDGTDNDIAVVNITVNNDNRPPVWDEIPDNINVDENEPVIIDMAGSDIDEEDLEITWESTGGTEIPRDDVDFTDNGNGTGSFTWQTDYGDEGNYTATFTISDDDLSDVHDVIITVGRVNRPPGWTEFPGPVTVDENAHIEFNLAGEDPEGDDVSFAYRSNDIPDDDQVNFTDNGNGTASFSWQTDYVSSGDYTATFTLSDGEHNVDRDLSITIINVNRSPVWGEVLEDTTVNESTLLEFTLTGSDLDEDDNLTIQWESTGETDIPVGQVDFTDNRDGSCSFAWDVTYDDAGQYTATFTLFDGHDNAVANVNITVNDVNRPPNPIVPDPISVTEGTLIEFTVEANDPDNDDCDITYSSNDLPDEANFNDNHDNTGSFSWETGFENAGNYLATFEVADGEFVIEVNVQIEVTDVNRPPIWDICPVEVTENENVLIQYTVIGHDPDGGDVTIVTSDELPEDFEFTDLGNDSGEVTWQTDFNDVGEYIVTFTLSDGVNEVPRDCRYIINNANRQPIWEEILDVQVEEGALVQFDMSGSDPDEENLTITYRSDDLPGSEQLTDNGGGSGSFRWQTDYEDEGNYTVAFVLSDGDLEAVEYVQITVGDVNRPPRWDDVPIETVYGDEASVIEFTVHGSDPDDEDVSITWRSTGGTDIPGGQVDFTDDGEGNGSFSWQTTYDDEGSYTATFTISDDISNVPVDVSIEVRGVNRPPVWEDVPDEDPIVSDEDEPINFTIEGSDPDGNPLRIAYRSDDIPEEAQFNDHDDGTGTFEWTPSYDDAGNYTAIFDLTDDDFHVETQVYFEINDVNRAPIWDDIPEEIIVDEEELVEFDFTGYDPDGNDDDLTINYDRDGVPDNPDFVEFVDRGNGNGSFRWQLGYDDEGIFTPTFTITDGNLSTDAVVTIRVGNVNRRPSWIEIPDEDEVDEGVQLRINLVADDPDEDELTFSYNVNDLPGGPEIAEHGDNTATFTWTPDYDSAGEYDVTFMISDGEFNIPHVITITVNDANRPPRWTDDVPESISNEEGELVEFTVVGEDLDNDDLNIVYSSRDLPENARFTYLGFGAGRLSWQTNYDDEGEYTATFTLSDGQHEVDVDVPISISDVNVPPYWFSYPDLAEVNENEPILFFIEGRDVDNDDLTITYDGRTGNSVLPDDVEFTDEGSGHGTFRWQTDHFSAGEYVAAFTLSDGVDSVSIDVDVIVINLNRAPVWTDDIPSAVHIDNAGDLIEFDITGTDPDEDDLDIVFTSDDLPQEAGFTYHGNGNGTFSWRTEEEDDDQSFTATFTLSDGVEEVAHVVYITIGDVNQPPVWEEVTNRIEVDESDAINFTVIGRDPEEDVLRITFSHNGLPDEASFVDNENGTGTFTWETTYYDARIYDLVFTLSDGEFLVDANVRIVVNNVSRAPEWYDVPEDIEVNEGVSIEFPVRGRDADNDNLRIILDRHNLPNAAEFNVIGNGWGIFSWQTGFDDADDYSVTFTLSDGETDVDTTVNITINDYNRPPVWEDVPGDIGVDEEEEIRFNVEGYDLDNDNLTIIYNGQTGDNVLPDEVDFTDLGNGAAEFVWQTTDSDAGSYTALFTISDGNSDVDSSVNITVISINSAPRWINPPESESVDEGEELSFTIRAVDDEGDPLDLIASSGDLPGGWGFTDNGNNTVTFIWTPEYSHSGNYTVRFTASDEEYNVNTDVEIIVVNVNRMPEWVNPPETVEANEGEVVQFTMVGNDPDGDVISMAMNRNDLPRDASFQDHDDGTGTLTWQTTYDDAGTYTPTFIVTDRIFFVNTDVEVIIHNVNRAPDWIDPPDSARVDEGELLEFTLEATDPDNDDIIITFDERSLPEDANFTDNENGTGVFSWRPSFDDAGLYSAIFVLSDGAEDLNLEIALRVSDVNRAPVWDEYPNPVTVDEPEHISFVVSGSDPDGDDLTIQFDRDGFPEAAQFTDVGNGGGVFSWYTTYDDAGDYTASFSLSDDEFNVVLEIDITINDINPPPYWAYTPDPITVDENSLIEFMVYADDLEDEDLTITWTSTGEDEIPQDVIQFNDLEDGSASFVWQTNYDDAGRYTATFTVSDGENDVDADVDIIINDINQPPIWIDVPDTVEDVEREIITFNVRADDLDGDDVTLTIDSEDLPDDIEFTDHGGGRGTFYWETGYNDAGEYTIPFIASDDRYNVEVQVLVIVNNLNREPSWYLIPNEMESDENEIIRFGMIGNDPDGNHELTISMLANDMPDDAVLFDSSNGRASFTWTPGYEDAGEYHPVFVLSDGEFIIESDVLITVYDVNRPPVWTQVPENVEINEAARLFVTVVGIDPDYDDLAITWESIGETDIPVGQVEFTDHEDGSATLDWLTSYADAGDYTAQFTISDGELEVTTEVTITVIDVNTAPIWVDVPDNIPVDEGDLVAFNLVGRDPQGDDLTIEYSSDDLPEAVEFTDNDDGNAAFSWQTSFADAGMYSGLFTLSDGVYDVLFTVLINVGDVSVEPVWDVMPDVVEVDEMQMVAFQVVGSDPDGDELTIVYYSYFLPDDIEFHNQGDRGAFIWQTGYDDAGVYTPHFVLSDGWFNVDEEVRIIVNNFNRAPVWDDMPDDLGCDEGELIEFTVSATDPDGDELTLEMSSDDLPQEVGFTDNGDGNGTVIWQTDINDAGEYGVTFSASDAEFTTDIGVLITITNQNRAPVWTDYPEDQRITGYIDQDVTVLLSVEDPDGDDIIVTWEYIGEHPGNPDTDLSVDGGNVQFTLNANRFEFGEYTVQFLVTDGNVDVPLEIVIDVLSNHFIYQTPGRSHELRITSLEHFGDVFGRDEPNVLDEIGVLTPEGVPAGAFRFGEDFEMPITILAWGDNLNTDEVEGFTTNEPFAFVYWDYEAGNENELNMNFAAGDERWRPGGFSLIELSIGPELTALNDPVDFGPCAVNDSTSQSIRFRNTGTVVIDRLSFLIDGNGFIVDNSPRDVYPDDIVDVEVTFQPDRPEHYSAVLHARADFVDLETVDLTGEGIRMGHFRYEITEEYHRIGVLQAYLENNPLQANDEIGIFTQDTSCAGAVFITGNPPYEIYAWGDIPDDRGINGFVQDEPFIFAYYDSSAQEVIYPNINYRVGPEEWASDEYSAVVLTTLDRHFHPIVTDLGHQITIEAVDFFGEGMFEGSEIAAITPRGDVAGSGGYTFDMPRSEFFAYGDNPETRDFIEGFLPREYIYFRLWDVETDQEYPARAEWEEGPNRWEENGESRLRLTAIRDNSAPTFTPIDDISLREGEEFTQFLIATDGDDDPISLSLIGMNLPQGTFFNDLGNGRALFSWTPAYNQQGRYTALFRAYDGIVQTLLEVDIRVENTNRPPVIGVIENIEINEGERLLLEMEANDPDNDPIVFSSNNLPPGARISGSILRWTPDYDQADDYLIAIRATDFGQPPMHEDTEINITVHNVNQAPIWETINGREIGDPPHIVRIYEGADAEIILTASDPDEDDIQLSARDLPDGAELNDGGDGDGLFTWQPDYNATGHYNLVFIAADNENETILSIDLYVLNVNRMPVIEQIDNQEISVGETVEFIVTANDPDEEDINNLELAVSNAPSGFSFEDLDDDRWNVTWEPEEHGVFPDVLFRVTDQSNGWDAQTVVFTALPDDDEPPVIAGLDPANEEVLTINRPAVRANISDEGSGLDLIELMFDDEYYRNFTFNENTGAFIWVPPSTLDEGSHSYSIRAHDRAGNRAFSNIVFEINTVSDEIEPNEIPQYTIYDNINLSGTTEPFRVVNLYRDDELLSQEDSDYRGRFTFEEVELDDGLNSFLMRCHNDRATAAHIEVFLDNDPPEFEIIFPVSYINDPTPRIRATISDEGVGIDEENGIYLAIDGVQVEDYSVVTGILSHNVQNDLREGEHHITLAVVDMLGNAADDSLDVLVIIDGQPPEIAHPFFDEVTDTIANSRPELLIPIFDPVPSSGIVGNRITLEVDEEELEYEWDEIEQSVYYSFSDNQPLENGSHEIYIDVFDNALNRTRITGSFFIGNVEDDNAPEFSNLFPLPESVTGDGIGDYDQLLVRLPADTVSFVISDYDAGVDWETIRMVVTTLNDPDDDDDDEVTEYNADDFVFHIPSGRVSAPMFRHNGGPDLAPAEMNALGSGINRIEVFGSDQEDHEGSAQWEFFYDPDAPETPSLEAPESRYANEIEITLNGSIGDDEPNYGDWENRDAVTVRIYRNEELVQEVPVEYNSDFECPVSLVEGDNTISATILDAGGNESEFSNAIEIFLDLTEPEIVGLDTERGPNISNVTPRFDAVIRDQGSGIIRNDVTFTVDDEDVVFVLNPQNGVFVSMVRDDLEAGEHLARLTVSDRAGNQLQEDYTFNIFLPPVDPPEFDLARYTSVNRVSLTGTTEAENEVVVSLNDRYVGIVSPDQNGAFTFNYNAAELPQASSVTVIAVSPNEVESDNAEPQILLLDTTPPSFSYSSPINGGIIPIDDLEGVAVLVNDPEAGIDPDGYSMTLRDQAVEFFIFQTDSGYWLAADVRNMEFSNNETIEVVANAQDMAVTPNRGRIRWEFVTRLGAAPIVMLPDTSFNEDEELVINLHQYISDIDHIRQELDVTAELLEGADNAELVIDEDGVLRLGVNDNWFGRLTVEVSVTDPDEQFASDIMMINVIPVNDAPRFNEMEDMEIDQGGWIETMATATDIDPGDELIFSDNSDLFDITPGGRMVFRTTRDMCGSNEIELLVQDQDGASDRTTFDLIVNAVNSPVERIASIDDAFIEEDSDMFEIADLDTVFYDADNDRLNYTITIQPEGVIIELDPITNIVTVEPIPNYHRGVSVQIWADDLNGSRLMEGFYVWIESINDPPEQRGQLPLVILMPEDSTNFVIANLDTVFYDIEDERIQYWTEEGEHLGVEIDFDNILSINPDPDWYGQESFILIADDGVEEAAGPVRFGEVEHPETSEYATQLQHHDTTTPRYFDTTTQRHNIPRRDEYVPIEITVSVTPVNDPPKLINPIDDLEVDEDSGPWFIADLTETFNEVDGDDFSVEAIPSGRLVAQITNDNLTIIAPENYYDSDIEVIVYAEDDTEDEFGLVNRDTFYVNILPVNDPPTVLNPIGDRIFDEDSGPWVIADLDDIFIDVDGDPLTFDLTSDIQIVWDVNADNELTMVTPENFFGTDIDITISASDGQNDAATAISNSSSRRLRACESAGSPKTSGYSAQLQHHNITTSQHHEVGPVRHLRSIDKGSNAGSASFSDLRRDAQLQHHSITTSQHHNIPRRDDFANDIFTMTVNPVNDPPRWDDISDTVESPELELIELFLTAGDADMDIDLDADQLTLKLIEDDGVREAGAYFTDNGDGTGTFIWQTDYQDSGEYYAVFRVSDRAAEVFDWLTINFFIGNMNRQIVLAQPLPDQAFVEDDPERIVGNLTDYFSDPDDEDINYSFLPGYGVFVSLDTLQQLLVRPEPNWNGVTDVIVYANDGYDTVIDTFIVSASSVNDLPTAFDLTLPVDSMFVTSFPSVQFNWQESVDIVEGSNVTYSLVLSFGDTTYRYTDIADTIHGIPRTDFVLDPILPTDVEWWVWAYDGTDSIRCNEPHSITVAAIHRRDLEPPVIPTELSLGNGYPNPFNAVMSIYYDLPEPTEVRVTVHDQAGRLVRVLVDDNLHAGRHITSWNGHNLSNVKASAGVYLVYLDAGLGSKVSRVVLLR
ncbi:MAG: Ig-like domain-containing protein [Candidatus Hatepunaea meridiana]|nr:Ig-like domain-containing protein [Candidatus Hatepunaea meridiana]